MSSQLLNDLILFTIDRSGDEGDHYDLNTDIEKHIGITGDDAADYMLTFSKRYNVDMSEFDFDKHFDPEGAGHPTGGLTLAPESLRVFGYGPQDRVSMRGLVRMVPLPERRGIDRKSVV